MPRECASAAGEGGGEAEKIISLSVRVLERAAARQKGVAAALPPLLRQRVLLSRPFAPSSARDVPSSRLPRAILYAPRLRVCSARLLLPRQDDVCV